MTKIFLVDDEPLVLIGMQGMLNWAELGYTVVGTARNGAEALKAIGETYPDIVVSDNPYAGHGWFYAGGELPQGRLCPAGIHHADQL